MFIGASPASTGGGIKTSTFAILLLSVKSLLKGEEELIIFNRTIPASSIKRALALLVSAIALVFFAFLIFLSVEQKSYIHLLFEIVSAFGTVGLSAGITPSLSFVGKLLIIILMYLGRIGPLTLGLALTREVIKGKIEYPTSRVMIG
jgi:trk system potassium uptake protein TrkH